jgi:hypothetical protein
VKRIPRFAVNCMMCRPSAVNLKSPRVKDQYATTKYQQPTPPMPASTVPTCLISNLAELP